MTHNEKRTVWWKEGLFACMGGLINGLVQVTVGQPFDTLKTKMQVQDEYKKLNLIQSAKKLYKSDGKLGFYRGGMPIILGASFFRSMQFSVFELVYSRFDKNNLKNKNYEKYFTKVIPYTKGLEVRTIVAGIASGICRSLVECPFEFVKIRRQIKTDFKYMNVYHGLFPLMLKNSTMVSIGFCFIDSFRRNTNAWNSSLGIFLATGTSTILCHILIWPIEIFRNNYMSKNKGETSSAGKIISENIKNYGWMKGLYRGALPGLISTFLRNGLGMLIFSKIQKIITIYGFRG
jgi:solute carrier family 25 carnitine/acylcarnitine transporter 20/29